MRQKGIAAARGRLEAVTATKPEQSAEGNGHGFIDRTLINLRLDALRKHRAALEMQASERMAELKNIERGIIQTGGMIMALEEIAAAGQVEKV